MKKLLILVVAFGLLLMPFTVYAQSDQRSAGTPSVSQPLVPEGDFALKLAVALKVGTPIDEAQAEDMLTSAGISPKNGWIADYPVTPNIIGELQNAVATAADSQRLPMGKDEALKAFHGLTTEFSLAVLPGSPGEYAENQPQANPAVINNYYYEEGPPVVTYYPPPPDYGYLYAWVPYPFWCSGFFFPGFFVLHDFHRRIIFANRVVFVSNHVFDRVNHRVVVVDPVRHSLTNVSHTTAFHSTATRNAASSIFNHSIQRTALTRGTQGITGNHASVPNGIQGKQVVVTNNGGNIMGSRTFSNSKNFANGSGMNHPSSQSFSRSFNAPSMGGSSSCGNCHGGSGSFGGSRSSHSSSSFSGGHASAGSSGGHSFGGFSAGGHGGGAGRR
jgi:hypothetical protein